MLVVLDRRDLRRLSDQLHDALSGVCVRLFRHRDDRFRSRLFPDHRLDEGGAARRGPAVRAHGLHHRAGGADGAPVPGVSRPAGADPRLALRRRHSDVHRVRDGDRHRRGGGDGARHHGEPDDDQIRLRRQAVRRRDHGRRHARHIDSALGDADRDGAGARRLGRRALFGRLRSRLPAGRHLSRSICSDARSSIRSSDRRSPRKSARTASRPSCGRSWSAWSRWPR